MKRPTKEIYFSFNPSSRRLSVHQIPSSSSSYRLPPFLPFLLPLLPLLLNPSSAYSGHCGQHLGTPSGVGGLIYSPITWSQPVRPIRCVWTIVVPSDSFILLQFLPVRLHPSFPKFTCHDVSMSVTAPDSTGNVEEVATRCPGENDEVLVTASTTNLTLVQRNWPTGLKAFRISWTAVSRAERCDQLLCMTTGYCVHFSLRCNYVPNCGDGDSTDEQACEGASFLIGLSIGLAGIFVGLFALFYSNIRSKVEEFARSVEAEAQSPNSSEDVTVRTTASVRYNPSSHRLNLVRHNVAVGGGAQSHGAVPVDSGATIGSGSLPEVRTSLELVALRHTLELLPYNDATPPPYHSICHTYTQTGSTSGEGVLGEGAPREGVIPEVFGKAEAGPVVEDGDGKPDDMAARGSDCFGGGGGAGGGSSSGGVAAGIVDADRRDFVTPPPSYHEVVGSVETLDGDEWQSN